jgi:uncharacterized phage protein (TIGR02218 family)
MKIASAGMLTHLATANPTSLAWLWKVKRIDGTLLGFSSFDRDITYDDGSGDGAITYLAKTGYTASAAASKGDLSVDNSEAKGFLDSAAITELALRQNLFDDALVTMMFVNWADLTMSHVLVRSGTLGIVKMKNGLWTAEHRGLTHRYGAIIGSTYGALCRAMFGSGLNGIDLNSQWLCMVDVTLYRQTGSVDYVTDAFHLTPNSGLLQVGSATPTAPAPEGWFDDGIISFTSGALDDASYEIKSWDGSELTLYLPIPGGVLPAPGDTFSIEPGCNKTIYDCANKYNNVVNFRGEPTIPGQDLIFNYPNAS